MDKSSIICFCENVPKVMVSLRFDITREGRKPTRVERVIKF